MTKIVFPICSTCGSEEAHICSNCGIFTCWECVTYPNNSTCIHRKFIPIKKWCWNEENSLFPMQHTLYILRPNYLITPFKNIGQ